VAVFPDDQFGAAFQLGVVVEHFLAVDEEDQVGVLLDGAGFAG
jgi:hypothetical protein